ncbi:hypothetical protein SAMN04487949_2532 [Halogranum gelatinilyticum]|uniref:Uncharacterized protein n=2 Tax=Halogranum gelatinilyticum TaxID=660521 RepID=A0A1G9VWG5_9EURY|nr:hypothetical protein SAMN04487949_2532 [Halogranum gelatinilyticum]
MHDGTFGTSYSYDWKPGETTENPYALELALFNTGTRRLDHLEIDFSNTTYEDRDGDIDENNDGTPDTPGDSGPDADTNPGGNMAKWIEVKSLTYTTTDGDIVNLVTDSQPDESHNGNTIQKDATAPDDFVSLADLAAPDTNEAVLDEFDPPKLGHTPPDSPEETIFNIDLKMNENIPNDYQGDVLRTDITFALKQAGQ